MKKFNEEALMLMCNSHHGIYIPNLFFKQNIEPMKIWCDTNGFNFEDYRPLNNPDNEDYWEAWEQLLNDYWFDHPFYGKCILYHNEDLWAYPEDMEIPEDYFA